MAITQAFARFYNLLANMGLVLRDDPPKVIDMTGREWGEPVEGLSLSVREAPKQHNEDPVVLSVVIRNGGTVPATLRVPGWLFFYEVYVVGPDGLPAPLTAYGRQLLRPERRTGSMEVTLRPGDVKEADVPVAALYEMRVRGEYRLRVSCRLHDGLMLQSNEIAITHQD